MVNEVTDLIGALRDGSMSLAEVEQRFRERTWSPTKPPPPASYLELVRRAGQDPAPDVPGSFDDVVAAYDHGEITRDQYRVLAEAVAESKRARQDRDQK
jgi:hypothetical protein